MADRISSLPTGIGLPILLQNLDQRWKDWQNIRVSITPDMALGAFSHLDAANFNRPGFGPMIVALAAAGIPAGSPEAEAIYQRGYTAASQQGPAWDGPPGPNATAKDSTRFILSERARIAAETGIGHTSYRMDDLDRVEGLRDQYRPDDQPYTLFGAIKGTARWLFLVLDAIPEGFDAAGRAAVAVAEGRLTAAQALGGMFGIDRAAGQQVGIPFFQYIRAAIEGERINQGTGWFATGEVAADIQFQLARYDAETNGVMNEDGDIVQPGLTQADFLAAARNGVVTVQGLGGAVYEARNLEEWKMLRNNAGRAKVLQDLQFQSPEQAVLGQAYGTFNEDIFDEATILYDPQTGTPFAHSVGRGFGSLVAEPNTFGFNVVSAPIDLAKQLFDLNVFGLVGKARAAGRAVRAVGLGDEAGQVARATTTVEGILSGADIPARAAVVNDLSRQTVNIDAATHSLARQFDDPLRQADKFTGRLRGLGPQAIAARLQKLGVDPEEAARRVTSPTVSNLINRKIGQAARGDDAAATWVHHLLEELDQVDSVKFADELANLRRVQARPDTDILRGVFGTPQVADDVLDTSRKMAEELDDLLRNGKGSVVIDSKSLKPTVTFDADLGRAQNTLRTLREAVVGTGAATAKAEGQFKGLVTNLFNERYAQVRYAVKTLGDNQAAADDVDNLIRVLRRNTSAKNLLTHSSDFAPRIPPDRLHKMLTGGGALSDMVDSIVAAKTQREVWAILGPTIEFGQGIPAAFVERAARATTRGEVVQLFTELGAGVRILPQRIGLLGNYAKAAIATTAIGSVGGGIAGGIQGAEKGEGFSDVLGGVLSGAVIGGAIGSGIGGTVGLIGGGLTRQVENIADTMDLLLAGARSTTLSVLATRQGVDMTRAQRGLGIPQQFSYALGHSAMGRRVARHAENVVNVNDPDALYYMLHDYARLLGFTIDETATVMGKGTGTTRITQTVVRSAYKTDDDYQRAIKALKGDGYDILKEIDMDQAMARIANLQANNTADAWQAATDWFDSAGALLGEKGMTEDAIRVLTDFARQGLDDYVGNVNAIGGGANFAQSMAINGEITHDVAKGAKLIAETWSGKLYMPSPEMVQRAMMQTDKLGKITGVLTGKGVVSQVMQELRKTGFGEDQVRNMAKAFTPELERNIAIQTARFVTGALWVPAILLTRPFAFMSRVLGEDQFRMTAAHLDNLFTHPFHYFSAVLANFDSFRKMGRLRGVAARSLIPDDIFDKSGKLIPDALDNMSNWDLAEDMMHKMGMIYDSKADDVSRVFGAPAWENNITRGSRNYIPSVATEYKQLLSDPIIRRMAASTADDVVDDTLDWLTTTNTGRKVLADWRSQFRTAEAADVYMAPDVLKAFLYDQHARLHLKTGGDWVYVIDNGPASKVVLNSSGLPVDAAAAARYGWDQLDAGYSIIRKGDDVLMEPLRTGRFNNKSVRRAFEDDDWDELKAFIRSRDTTFQRAVAKGEADPVSLHKFPDTVKGQRSIPEPGKHLRSTFADVLKAWDDGLDRMFQFWLGRPTRVFSRQPVLGNYYWERIGTMLPSMSDDVAEAFRAIAKKEGQLRNIDNIGEVMGRTGVAKGILDDFAALDLNAKAYAIERTKDTLFDLTRQRNFVDAMRIVVPFAGPAVEAFEAWSRVIRERPIEVWRRGGQIIDHLWDPSPIALEESRDDRGMFWVNQDGEEMITVPFSGRIMGWLHDHINEGISPNPIDMRARGFNVVFGPDDMRADEDPQAFAGVPTGAFNFGSGPVFNLAVEPLLKGRDGVTEAVNEFLFPFGKPPNWISASLPFHLRQILEGKLGKESQKDQLETSVRQWAAMVANGQVGEGDQYEWDISTSGGVARAWAEAQRRGFWANLVEGFARGSLPTMVSPELMVELPRLREEFGFDSEAMITVSAYAAKLRELMTEEGAEWWETPDGYRISTEGDVEAATAWLNDTYGTHMYSGDLLSLPVTRRQHPLSVRETGAEWYRQHPGLREDLPNSGVFLMPDYALVEKNEPYSFDAAALYEAEGDIKVHTAEDIEAEIQSRLLKAEYDKIDRLATMIYGPDDLLDPEDREQKQFMVAQEKERARGRWERGIIPEGITQKAFNELLGWDTRDWSQYSLTDAEAATVRSVLWYLKARDQALDYLRFVGVTGLDNQGQSAAEKEMVQAVVADLRNLVDAQFRQAREQGLDMGNFGYLWDRVFAAELDQNEPFDALAALAEARSLAGTP